MPDTYRRCPVHKEELTEYRHHCSRLHGKKAPQLQCPAGHLVGIAVLCTFWEVVHHGEVVFHANEEARWRIVGSSFLEIEKGDLVSRGTVDAYPMPRAS